MTNAVEQLKSRIAELKEEISSRQRKLAAYEQTLQVELSDGNGAEGSIPDRQSGDANKAAFIRQFIQNTGEAGTTYQAIRRALEDAKIETHPNYSYTVVNKWKKQAKIAERGGRLYWVQTIQLQDNIVK